MENNATRWLLTAECRVSTIGLLSAIHTAPQSPALHRTRSCNEMPTSGGTHNPPPMLPARPKSPKSPTLQEKQEGRQPSPVTLSPNFTLMPAAVGSASPSVAPQNLELPMLISSQASLRDASPPPTQLHQANTMPMQCSAPPAQPSSKITRYEFECANAHAHLGGSCVRACVQVCFPHSQTMRSCLSPCHPLSRACALVLHTGLCPHRTLRVPLSLICDLYRARSPVHSYSRPLPPITNRATRVSPAANLTSSATHRNYIRRQSTWLRAKHVQSDRRLN